MTDIGPVAILCVCTGNVCRSPAAERLLTSTFGESVAPASAGTHALVGQPISPPMGALLASAGADPGGFAARSLVEPLVKSAELILTMTQDQRGDVVEMWPKAVRRTFTLKEFARLLAAVDPRRLPDNSVAERLRDAVPLAAAQRRQVDDPRVDEVVDPYGLADEVYAAAFADIQSAVTQIAVILRLASVGARG
jgi:protein-tyrosine phosphatase